MKACGENPISLPGECAKNVLTLTAPILEFQALNKHNDIKRGKFYVTRVLYA
jgi:hypothetical protein